jgi:hypothetical protein
MGCGLAAAVPAGAAEVAPPRLGRISLDGTSTPEAQHSTEVEPDAYSFGSKVVAAFQVGRYFEGGAAAIGFGTSTDAGRTWRSGLLPELTEASSPPGPAAGASDPVVAYDALHARWLIATLSNFAGQSVLLVSGSPDGLTWAAPAAAVTYPRNPVIGTSLDKPWLTCDNEAGSPFRGRCYVAYTDIAHDTDPQHLGSNIAVQASADGGLSWSEPVLLSVNANTVSPGVQPVVRPNGELVVVFFEDGVVQAVRSMDGATTFSPRERVSKLAFHRRAFEQPAHLRSLSLPSATVDAAGTVYVAWPDCRFHTNCRTDDIVITRSTAPGRWTAPRRAPLGPLSSGKDFLLPDLAAAPQALGRLALTYYALPVDCIETNCLLDVFLVTSKSAGTRWTRPHRLNPARMRLGWLAETASGRMVGDYTGTVFAGTRVVSVHVQARAPRKGRFNEAAYAFSQSLP